VVPDGELESAAREIAGRMLRNSPLALRLTKECLEVNVDAGSLGAAIAVEDRNQILASSSSDFREGIAAFLEKREPKFLDR
jgi:enoyl-CoA hydratase